MTSIFSKMEDDLNIFKRFVLTIVKHYIIKQVTFLYNTSFFSFCTINLSILSCRVGRNNDPKLKSTQLFNIPPADAQKMAAAQLSDAKALAQEKCSLQ